MVKTPDTPASADQIGRRKAAAKLLRAGDFDRALDAYERLLQEMPNDLEVVQNTAALRSHTGQPDAGGALITEYLRKFPLSARRNSKAPARPRLLIMRGHSGAAPQIVDSDAGGFDTVLRGGHFSTQYLVTAGLIRQMRYTIVGGTPPAPGTLPKHEVMINTISDPDIEGASLDALAAYLDADHDGPLINRPDRVRRTTRDANYQRLRGRDDLTFPKTVRLAFRNATADAVAREIGKAGFSMPLILRRTGTQTGRTTGLIESAGDLKAYVGEGLDGEFYAIAYHDIRWDSDHYRKLRLFSIDGAYYPVVCHIDTVWNVHGGNRKAVMRDNEALMDEERRFLADWRSYVGATAADTLDWLAEDTGLEFFGVDFTLDEAGKPFIYELNPSMRHSYGHAQSFPYKLPFDLAVTAAFETMIADHLPPRHADRLKAQIGARKTQADPHLQAIARSALQHRKREARALFRAGRLGPAAKAYEALLRDMPDDHHVVLTTAVLRSGAGKRPFAQKLVQDYVRRNPMMRLWDGDEPKGPVVLTMRGYNGTDILVKKKDDGDYTTLLRGGHFTTEYLLDPGRVDQMVYTIGGDSPVDTARLPKFDLILNSISDPDLEMPALHSVEKFIAKYPDVPLINRPDKVCRTTRDGNYQRLRDMPGVGFPHTRRFRFDNTAPGKVMSTFRAAGFTPPFILRETGSQTGETTARIDSAEDLARYVGKGLTGEFYAIAYRELLWKGEYFRKMRLFSIDGTAYPVVCHLDRFWNVHGANRLDVMLSNEALMDQEKAYLADWRSYVGAGAADALDRVMEDTALEFFGVDFDVDDNGEPFIFELNATMRHSFDHSKIFEYKRPYDQAVTDAFEAMITRRLPAPAAAGPAQQ